VGEKVSGARRRATKDNTKIIIYKNSQLSKIKTFTTCTNNSTLNVRNII